MRWMVLLLVACGPVPGDPCGEEIDAESCATCCELEGFVGSHYEPDDVGANCTCIDAGDDGPVLPEPFGG